MNRNLLIFVSGAVGAAIGSVATYLALSKKLDDKYYAEYADRLAEDKATVRVAQARIVALKTTGEVKEKDVEEAHAEIKHELGEDKPGYDPMEHSSLDEEHAPKSDDPRVIKYADMFDNVDIEDTDMMNIPENEDVPINDGMEHSLKSDTDQSPYIMEGVTNEDDLWGAPENEDYDITYGTYYAGNDTFTDADDRAVTRDEMDELCGKENLDKLVSGFVPTNPDVLDVEYVKDPASKKIYVIDFIPDEYIDANAEEKAVTEAELDEKGYSEDYVE